ncbi:DUF1592 domain-containing protein [Aeoliella sp. SH292]|uniref:DUF1592 domain-containing protein n=1 Tax=Aeoliella sp. SH292 TaxID=3454464 RepID=UPI003F949F61
MQLFRKTLVYCIALVATAAPTLLWANDAGMELFANQCVRCHGDAGAGTTDYPTPLAGELSVLQLAEQIRVTMPEDNPESLTREQAQAIAEYIHGAFYSSIAQARNEPPTIELARLTVNQYRQATTDLVGSFGWQANWDGGGGLKGEYFDTRYFWEAKDKAVERVDPTIDFDFGSTPPVPEIKDHHQYSIRWTGSLLAPETGWHEIVVETEHAVRLWINNNQTEAIDGWVKSGDDDVYRARVYLLGGRPYPLRLEFSRATQGVDDQNIQDKNRKDEPTNIHLRWVPPGGAEQVIPARNLSPSPASDTYVVTTPFPPDDRSYGWERGTAVSEAWFEAVTAAAIETTGYVVEHLDKLSDSKADQGDRREKLQKFCQTFAERAIRRPLDDELRTRYVEQQFANTDDLENAVRRSLLMTLTSPRFLFREVSGGSEMADVAARMSFGLWDSMPDKELWRAMGEGQLASDDQLRQQATRMLADPRAKWKLRQFLFAWLQMDTGVDLSKDRERFPEFDAHTQADLRTSLDLFLDEVVWSDSSDYRRLFLADEVFLNQRLAQFYGLGSEVSGEFVKARLDDGRRAGVLTHPYVMSKFAHVDVTSPIHRGVFLVRGVLGQPLKPPPEAVAPLPADLHPELTTRERVTLQTKPAACMTCHHVINPLGFTLERFDAVGRYRETEQNQTINDQGEYQPPDGPPVKLAGARDLAKFLAESDEVSEAFVEQMFHYMVQQSLEAYGPEVRTHLQQSFVDSGYSIRNLAIEIAVASSKTGRQGAPGP